MAVSLERQRKAYATRETEMPLTALTPRETEFYAAFISGVPALNRSLPPTRELCAAAAQAAAEAEAATALISAEGLVVRSPQGVKPHPACHIRDAASKRLAALLSRMKLSPQGDARESARMASYEHLTRGGATLTVVGDGSAPAGPAPDWTKLVAEMDAKKKGGAA